MMSLVDYGDSEEERQSESESETVPQPAPKPQATKTTVAEKKAAVVDLGSVFGNVRAKAQSEKKPTKSSMFFRQDDDESETAADDSLPRKKVSTEKGGSGLADMLPAPKHRQSMAATIKLPPKPAIAQQTGPVFTDEIEEDILNSRFPADVQPQTSAPVAATAHLEGLGYALQDSYSASEPAARTAASHAHGHMDQTAQGSAAPDVLADPSMPEEFRQHLRAGAKVVELNRSDLTRNASRAQPTTVSIGTTIGEVVAPGKTAKRKHQLTYLAWNAREIEQQLQEKRSQGQKTKSETALKYGW